MKVSQPDFGHRPEAAQARPAGTEVAKGRTAAPGQLAKLAVLDAIAAGAELPGNAQGMAASAIAKGASAESVFSAMIPSEEPSGDTPSPAPASDGSPGGDVAPVAEEGDGTPSVENAGASGPESGESGVGSPTLAAATIETGANADPVPPDLVSDAVARALDSADLFDPHPVGT